LETHCSTVDDCVEQIVAKLKEMDHI
jgi:hypothetical protein